MSSAPDLLLSDNSVSAQVNAAIAEIESSLSTQADIDSAYSEWCNIVTDSMYNDLQFKTITCGPRSNKKRRTDKPWWSNTLSSLWYKICEAERLWLGAMTAVGKVN